jgi:hypothetical protein
MIYYFPAQCDTHCFPDVGLRRGTIVRNSRDFFFDPGYVCNTKTQTNVDVALK